MFHVFQCLLSVFKVFPAFLICVQLVRGFAHFLKVFIDFSARPGASRRVPARPSASWRVPVKVFKVFSNMFELFWIFFKCFFVSAFSKCFEPF